MKKITPILLFIALAGCSLIEDDKKFIRKEFSNGDITVKWYYYSYISNLSPDFIEISKNGYFFKIFEADDVVTNVSIKQKKITIKLFEPHRGIVYTKNPIKNIFGYKILIDSNSTYNDYKNTPDGILEK